jgi:hypothetical protein
VIFARHTTARLFYCRFPVSYLRNIAKHGAQYKHRVPEPQGVHLQRTQSYELRDPVSRAQFFRLLCRLIFYLSSGRSHVPFLWNHAHNAINTVCPPSAHLLMIRATGRLSMLRQREVRLFGRSLGVIGGSRAIPVIIWRFRVSMEGMNRSLDQSLRPRPVHRALSRVCGRSYFGRTVYCNDRGTASKACVMQVTDTLKNLIFQERELRLFIHDSQILSSYAQPPCVTLKSSFLSMTSFFLRQGCSAQTRNNVIVHPWQETKYTLYDMLK